MTDRLFAVSLFLLACAGVGCSTADSRDYFASGERYLQDKQFEKAVVELRNAVKEDENWGEARLKLADAYAATSQPELAFREYVRAADQLPDSSEAQLKAASYLMLARQFEDAVSRARRGVELAPQDVDARIVLANALAGVRDLEGALEHIREAIAVDPTRSQPYTALARLRTVQGRNDEARAAYAEALRIEPNSIPAHLALANFLWSHGDRSSAEQTLKKAYALDPANLLTNRVLATFFLVSSRQPEAESYLRFVADTSRTAADRLALADFYISQQRPAEARVLLTALVTDRRQRNAAETRLSRLDDGEGNSAGAEEFLKRVLTRNPNYVPALLLRAEQSLRAGKYAQALADANAAIGVNPQMAAAHHARAEAEMRMHRETDAIKSYTEVLQLEPGAIDAMIALSRLQLARNAIDSAVLYAEEAANAAPDAPEVRLVLIRAWLARGDDDRAGDAVAELLKAPRPPVEAFVLDGSVRLKRGDTAGARKALERALTIEPRTIEALTILTGLDARERKFAPARARLDAVLQKDPDNIDVLPLAAKVALASGELTSADDILRRCVAHDSHEVTCFALLARLYQSQKRLDALVREFDELARRQPAKIGPRLMAAIAVHTAGDVTEAERRYEEILKLAPRTALAANNLAALLVEQGSNLAYAEQLATTAVEQMPANAEMVDTLGSVYLKRSFPGQAVKWFQQAVALEPDNPVFQFHLGQAYVASEDPARAREAFGTAIRLNAKFQAARDALAALGR